ncbi:DUF6488 family protein [Thalassotalea sp. ND16A]|uniref:DUF6488 family protein n=1 Tax=Thalassotalea sp. ND16A TaxID=1535422 RepID=UPI00051A769B|nr:DUF6488 family protein [Thalassotalea sp. ND16A]KGJ94193.1 hypothetical protein ND16A_1449 [Thalassotalea sp. ND16A]
MKNLMVMLFIGLMLNMGTALAHGAHGKISEKQAIQVAIKATQKLTFKDFGFNVGKLDESWESLTTEDFKLYAAQVSRYIISASNKADNKTIYFLMTMSGEVLKVNQEAKF